MAIKTHSQRKRILGEEPVETKGASIPGSLEGIGKSAARSIWKDFLSDSTKTLTEQLLGWEQSEDNRRFREEVVLFEKKTKRENPQLRETETALAHQEYARTVTRPEAQADRTEQVETQRKIEELRVEIKKLIQTSQEVTMLFKQVSNEVATREKTVKPGRYHLNFFEWVLFEIRKARMRIEEGVTWMKLFASKKRQRQYWNMFKKHGTTFGLSHERTAATQTG